MNKLSELQQWVFAGAIVVVLPLSLWAFGAFSSAPAPENDNIPTQPPAFVEEASETSVQEPSKTQQTAAPKAASKPQTPVSSCWTAEQSWDHIGEAGCVYYYVGSPFFSSNSNTSFLNERSDYRNGFTAVIFNSDLYKFADPVNDYGYKNIEVSGQLETYEGHPQIVVDGPSQIVIK